MNLKMSITFTTMVRTYRDILTNHELQLITKVKRRDQANTEKANS